MDSPLKEEASVKRVITLPMSKVDKKFFDNNINKFKKQYEITKSKIYETGYESFKEFYTNHPIRKKKEGNFSNLRQQEQRSYLKSSTLLEVEK